jgi:hypothetical protein
VRHHHLWEASTTTNLDRKQIIRTMIKEVRLGHRDKHLVEVTIIWADGSDPTMVQAARTRHQHTCQVFMQLIESGLDAPAIAQRLDELGILTRFGRKWTPKLVERRIRKISSGATYPDNIARRGSAA